MNKHLKWDDLQIVLEIARSGTLSGAGRSLRISHATVFRRIDQIEKRLGVKLFDRSRNGYKATVAGEEVAETAERIEHEILKVERQVVGRDIHPSGTVRVTTTDTLFVGLLSPVFTAFRQKHPEIKLEVVVSNEFFNLSKREADVAIRPSFSPLESLVGREIGVIQQAVYCETELSRTIDNKNDLRSETWIGPDESMVYRELEQWMIKRGLSNVTHYRVNSLMGMFASVRDGAGMAVLPCYMGDNEKSLRRIGEIIPELATNLWLLTHPDLRTTARVRVFLDFVAESAKASISAKLLG